MIRLDLDSGETDVELMAGVTVTVAPITAEVIAIAQADPVFLATVAPGRAEPGTDDPEDTDQARPAAINPVLHVAFSKAIARASITGWEGVGDTEGNVLEISPKGITRLLDIDPALAAWQLYLAPKLRWMKEGNGFAPSPTGTSAGAQTTAGSAESGAGNAPTS